MDIREAAVEDVPAFDRIRKAVYPWHIASLDAQRNWFHATTPDTRPVRPVALVDGEIAGFALGKLKTSTAEPGVAAMYVNVDPAYRRRGVGGALYDIVASHLEGLGVRKVQVDVADIEEAQRFATGRGFRQGHCDRYSALDPRQLPTTPSAGHDVTLLPI